MISGNPRRRRKGVLVLIAMLFCIPALAAWDVAALMDVLARHPAGKARFTEIKTLAMLDAPVVSTGELIYSPPDRLEKNTVAPKSESLVVEGDTLVLERDGRRRELSLRQYPEALSIVEAVRGTLIGNRGLLEQHYKLALKGDPQNWQLILKPLEARVLRWVQEITVTGRAGEIIQIDTEQADGDKSSLRIEPLR
jgi:outer membrane lipoprotein-sorting protein